MREGAFRMDAKEGKRKAIACRIALRFASDAMSAALEAVQEAVCGIGCKRMSRHMMCSGATPRSRTR